MDLWETVKWVLAIANIYMVFVVVKAAAETVRLTNLAMRNHKISKANQELEDRKSYDRQ